MRFKTLSLAIAVTNLAISNAALAQQEEVVENDAPVAEETTTDGGWGIEEIVVTATKRETSLMDTPIAISAFSEEELDRQGIKTIADLNNVVPNMSITMSDYAQGVPVITLRGVRSTNVTEVGDPAVGIHFDGAYTPRPQAAMALMFDIERAEALRGPQGTLYGRNSTVGSLNIISKRPDFDGFSASVQGEFGKWNQRVAKGWVNIPVTDTFALRAAGMVNRRDSDITGYWDPNQYDTRYLQEMGIPFVPKADGEPPASAAGKGNWGGADNAWLLSDVYEEVKADPSEFYNNQDNWALRISSYWEPSDSFSWLASAERYEDSSAGGAGTRDCARIAHRGDDWYVNGDDGIAGTADDREPGTCTDLWGTEDNFVVYANIPGINDLTIDSVRSRIEYQMTDEIEFVYIYGFQQQVRQAQTDIDQGLYDWDMAMRFTDNNFKSNTHELQFKSTGDGSVQWIAGYFYLKEDNKTDGQFHHSQMAVYQWDQPKRTVESEALFAQATWEFVDSMFLTLGGRYTEDTKADIGGRNRNCEPNWGQWWAPNEGACHPAGWGYGWGPGENAAGRDDFNSLPADYYDDTTNLDGSYVSTVNDTEESWSHFDYRVGLDWQVNDDTLLYTYYATGYKSGSIGDVVYDFDGEVFPTAYDEELVGTFELGAKVSLFDNKLNLRANYFYTDFDDYQLSAYTIYDSREIPAIDPNTGDQIMETQNLGTWLTGNVGNSMIQGLELEMEFAPWEGGFIGGYLTFLDTELTSDYYKKWEMEPNQVFGYSTDSDIPNLEDPSMNPISIRNINGNNMAYSPEVAFTVNMSHTFELGFGTLTPFVNIHWEDESYTSIVNADKWDLAQSDIAVPLSELDKVYSDKRDDFYVVTANLNFTSSDKAWYVEAGVYNLTDEDFNYWQGYGGNTATAAKARQSWSLRLGYNF